MTYTGLGRIMWRVDHLKHWSKAAAQATTITRLHRNHKTRYSWYLVTAVLQPPGQRCETGCLNSFGNRISPSDNSNDRSKHLCLVSWAAAPCV